MMRWLQRRRRLRALAADIVNGHVFAFPYHFNEHSSKDVGMVYMTLLLQDDRARDAFILRDPCCIYERMEKAMPSSISGMPIFASHHEVPREDEKLLNRYVAREAVRRARIERRAAS